MKAFFSVSSRTKIDECYLDDAKYISDGIAKLGYDLVIGVAMNEGMPGEVLKSFKDNNRKIYLKTLKVYGENPEEFNYVDFEYSNDTFERTKRIYDESDILIMMLGGTGTTAEIFSFLEQARTDSWDNKTPKTIVIYNKGGHYNQLLSQIKEYINKGFNDESIYEYLNIFTDRDELIDFVGRQFQESKEKNDK